MRPRRCGVWRFAMAWSLAFHAAVLFGVPCFTEAMPDPPIMKVSFVARRSAFGGGDAAPEVMRTEAPVRERFQRKAEGRSATLADKKPAARHLRQTKASKVTKAPVTPSLPSASPAPSAPSDDAPSAPAGSGGSASQAGGSGQTVDVSTLAVLKMITPDYPAFSRKRGEEGTVKIIVAVENGAVTAAEVEVSSGFARLDASAMRAVRQWRFGGRLCARVRVPFVFRLR